VKSEDYEYDQDYLSMEASQSTETPTQQLHSAHQQHSDDGHLPTHAAALDDLDQLFLRLRK